MNKVQIVLIFCATALLAACAPQPSKPGTLSTIKPFEVKLAMETDGQGKDVLVNKNVKNSKCGKFADKDDLRKGCIVAQLNEELNVEFKLSGTGGWYFSEFRICPVTDTQNKPSDAAFNACTITPDEAANWMVVASKGVAAPDASGIVDLATVGDKKRKFNLRDFNWEPGTFFYRIKACKDKPDGTVDTCVSTDPGGENFGRGRN